MKYITIPPSKKLASYVRYFWVLEGEAAFDQPYIHRSMADGCAEMIFHYKGTFDDLVGDKRVQSSFTSGLAGQSNQTSRFIINQNFGIFGAYLYPYAATALFSIPATELKNQMPDLTCLIGQDAAALEEQMMLAVTHEERVSILSSFLETRIPARTSHSPGIFETIQHIIDTKGITTVEDLASRNFISKRQFERRFVHNTGFTPKHFSRIIRFQSTLSQYGHRDKSLTDIAYETGYYDQSHFIQDFKQFSGFNPKEYFLGKTEATKWKDVE